MKNKTMTFEQKAKQLTARQIIELMLDAVRNPVVKLDFDAYGRVKDGERYGCAATNAVCKLSGVTFTVNDVGGRGDRASAISTDCSFLGDFERAIDNLRCGLIWRYNYYAELIGLARIKNVDFYLPPLENGTYKQHLHFYEKLAEAQDE